MQGAPDRARMEPRDDDDDELKATLNEFFRCIGRLPTGQERDAIRLLLKTHKPQVVLDALQKAGEHGAKSIKYVSKVIENGARKPSLRRLDVGREPVPVAPEPEPWPDVEMEAPPRPSFLDENRSCPKCDSAFPCNTYREGDRVCDSGLMLTTAEGIEWMEWKAYVRSNGDPTRRRDRDSSGNSPHDGPMAL